MGFGPRLRALRVRAKLTQAGLANRAGILAHSVYRYEAGKTRPGTEIAQRLARALGVTLDELVSEKRQRKAS